MSRLKHLSKAGWVVLGVVLALVLIPTMAVAATLAYNGIQGTNGTTTAQNKAGVTSAGQLLTTEAPPQKYVFYSAFTNSDSGEGNGCDVGASDYYDCEPLGPSPAAPSGESLVVQAILVDAQSADAPAVASGIGVADDADNESQSAVELGIVPPGDGNNSQDCIDYSTRVVDYDIPNGSPGTGSLPFSPGYVVPKGYSLCLLGNGFGGQVYLTGYVVPSADTSSSPELVASGTAELSPFTKLRGQMAARSHNR